MATMSEREITLAELLESRDRRRMRQIELLGEYSGCTLVLLTIVTPGPVKRNSLSLTAAGAAVDALRQSMAGHAIHEETYDRVTGYEAFFVTDLTTEEAKRRACDIEDTHPLGRLFDIDVMNGSAVPVSRTSLGLPSRRCLVCGDDARVCMRLNRHDYNELNERIRLMVEDYEQRHNL